MTEDENQSLARQVAEVQHRLLEAREQMRGYKVATVLFAGMLVLDIILHMITQL
jgi:hypothetical protein